MSSRSDRNFSTRRDQSFHHLKSNFGQRVPLANADDANPAVPTNLIAQKPPGGYEEGSLIYNQNNNSAYIRTTDGGAPTWTLLTGGGGGGGENLNQTLLIGNLTGVALPTPTPVPVPTVPGTSIVVSDDDLIQGSQGNVNISPTGGSFATLNFLSQTGGTPAVIDVAGARLEGSVGVDTLTSQNGAFLYGGPTQGTNSAGAVGMIAGPGNGSAGGRVFIFGGDGTTGTDNGGPISIRGGNSTATSSAGGCSISAGLCLNENQNGAPTTIFGGHNTSTVGGIAGGGGVMTVAGGTAFNTNGFGIGGLVQVIGGNSESAGLGGNAVVRAGESALGTSGSTSIQGGNNTVNANIGTSTLGTGQGANNWQRTLVVDKNDDGAFEFISTESPVVSSPATHLYFAQPTNPVLTPGPNITASFTTGGGGFFEVTDTCGIVVVTAGAGGVSPVSPLFTLTFDKAFPGNRRPVITLSEDPDVAVVGPYLQTVSNTSFAVNTSVGMGDGDVVRIHYQVMSCFFNNT